jgi:hypothetical protein
MRDNSGYARYLARRVDNDQIRADQAGLLTASFK